MNAVVKSFGGSILACQTAWTDGQAGLSDFTAPVGVGLDALGLFLDPVAWVVGKLLEPIYNWILEHCKPLRTMIESVTGSPDQVRAQAEQHQRAAQQVAEQANQLIASANTILAEWEGEARDAFRQAVEAAVETQEGVSEKEHQVANAFYMLAGIVSAVKEIVVGLIKGLINDLVSKAVMAAAAALPSLGATIAAYTAWAAGKYALVMGRLAKTFQKLATKLSKFVGEASKLGQFFQRMAKKFDDLAADYQKVSELAEKNKTDKKHNIPLARKNQEKWERKRDERTDPQAQERAERKRQRYAEDEQYYESKVQERRSEINDKADGYGPGRVPGAVTSGAQAFDKDRKRDDRSNPADSIGDLEP